VTAINREPTPPGPVTELFDRLDQLHLTAGRPSMRDIALKVGRGRISSSTVHNVFRRSRVPRWVFVEEIVTALQGDTVAFKALWEAAWQADHQTQARGDSRPAVPPPSLGPMEPGSGPAQRIRSNEIPARNPNFIGRMAELERLRANLQEQSGPRPPVQVLSGMGGIGKTEIATEYIHRNRDRYDIIWWIRAEHHDRVRDALVRLGEKLELRQAIVGSGRERAIAAVLETLESGVQPSWLLVYDNAAQPLELQRYLPKSLPGGHIIITTRLPAWPGYVRADYLEVSLFSAEEAIGLLRRRVSALAVGDDLDGNEDDRRAAEARRLATVLGGLPIATEHAAAYLAATGQSVGDYVTRFGEYLSRLDEQSSEFPAPILAAWEMSATLLSADAEHLFNLCAFFSPEPIAAELLLQNAEAVTGPPGLAEVLGDSRRFRTAAARLHRLSLVKVDGARDVIQMHRVVQAVTERRLRQERPAVFFAYRAAVDSLLAESDPGNPDRGGSDVTYDLSLQHLESDRSFFNTENPSLRRLIIHQVRRLHLRGGHVEAMQFGTDALGVWRDRLGHDDLQVLSLAIEVAIAMRWDGHTADARDLIEETLRLLQARYGDEHEVTLLCANTRGADLRTHSQFTEALKLDVSLLPKFERVFGIDHDRTLNVRNNLGADYRRLGRFRQALETDRRTFEDRVRILGPNDLRTLTSYDAVARDLRGLGLYQESLDTARKVIEGFANLGGRENLDLLNARKGFAAALRKVGYPEDSLQESEDVVQRYLDYLGPEHTYTLRAAANLINDRRAADDLARAEDLAREVLDRCQEAGHPPDLSYGTMVNLASVLRASGRPAEARRFDLQAWHRFIDVYGDLHPFALEASINYASDLAACGDLAGAIRIGQETLAKCRTSLGEDHPDTLMAAANLAIDEAASGNRPQADRLLADALHRYEETLTAEHPEARAAAQETRLTAEIEPW
jgi:tetratricopeptide (TPR) repeat protein